MIQLSTGFIFRGRVNMKKIFLITVFIMSFFTILLSSYAEDAPSIWPGDVDKIIDIDPAQISEDQFYDYELAIIGAYSYNRGQTPVGTGQWGVEKMPGKEKVEKVPGTLSGDRQA